MNWNKVGYLALRGTVAIGVLLILGLVLFLAFALFLLFAEAVRPIIESFGLAAIVFVPLTFGVLYIGWNLAGHIMERVKKEYNL